MAEYILKPGQEQFQVVDGPFENRQYKPGVVYHDIPPEERHRFDEIVIEPAASTRKGKTEKVEAEQ